MHAAKLHSTLFQELIFRHIQRNELWANVRHATQEVWMWVATEAIIKITPLIQLRPLSRVAAHSVSRAYTAQGEATPMPLSRANSGYGGQTCFPLLVGARAAQLPLAWMTRQGGMMIQSGGNSR
jgi:hypothetical protein